jgi:hypothetical protein
VKEHLSLSLYPKKPSTIASGATAIGSARHATDDIITQSKQQHDGCKEKVYLSLYSIFFLTIALGATPIGSTGRAPDEIIVFKKMKEDLFIDVSPIGREFILVKSWTT